MNKRRKKIKKILKGGIFVTSSALVFLLFVSWYFFEVGPVDITKYGLANLGSASGTQVRVPENPYNTLAQQFIEKEEELNKREEMVEGALVRMEEENRFLMGLILALVVMLSVFLLLNFYLDYRARVTGQRFS